MRADEKIERIVRETFGGAVPIVASLRGHPPDGGSGAVAAGGVVGGAAGAITATVLGAVMKARSLPDVASDANGAPGLAALGRVGPVLLVLTPTRLVGWDAKGKRLLCDVPVAQLSGVATEPSIGLISRVLVIQAGDTEVRIDAIRGAVARFAELLAQRIGQPVDVRRKEQSFWLVRAFVVGSLYFFGVSSVLLSIPQYSDKGPASAAFWLAAGLVMVCLGEFARRRLLSRKRRSVESR